MEMKNASIETLRFENVTFGYSATRPVFDKLNFDFPVGKIVMVDGAPGSGQSTFLKLLAVLMQPNSGSYFVNDLDTSQMSFEQFLPLRRLMSYTFDHGGVFANRTLLDNLTLPLLYHKICSVEEAVAEATALSKEFGFFRQIDDRPAAVSGGLRKLICTLRSFMQKPQMLVMDDPFTGLDGESVKKLIALIQSRRESGMLKQVFLTSRDETWAKKLEHDTLILNHGKIEFHENSAGVKREAA
jgi:phospholipid/cholesterol/gamma-HCH transport system ATP-binding protein